MKKIVHKSAAPIYAAAVVWVLYALLLPLYKPGHFIMAAAASVVVFLIARIFCKDVVEEVEEKPQPTGNPELDKMISDGELAIREMRRLNDSIKDETISRQIDRLDWPSGGPTHRPSCRCSWIPPTEAGASHCGRSAGGGDGLQNVISGQGQARRRACLPLPICRIRLPVGEHRPGFGDRRGDDPIGCPDIGIFS